MSQAEELLKHVIREQAAARSEPHALIIRGHQPVIGQLRDKGSVTRGWIGVQIQTVTPDIADSMGLMETTGALVSEPQKDSPAAKAGIQSGDIITSVNDVPVHDPRELARKIGTMAPGTSVKLGVTHQGQTKTLTLALGTLPEQKEASTAPDQNQQVPDQRAVPDGALPELGLTLVPSSNSIRCSA